MVSAAFTCAALGLLGYLLGDAKARYFEHGWVAPAGAVAAVLVALAGLIVLLGRLSIQFARVELVPSGAMPTAVRSEIEALASRGFSPVSYAVRLRFGLVNQGLDAVLLVNRETSTLAVVGERLTGNPAFADSAMERNLTIAMVTPVAYGQVVLVSANAASHLDVPLRRFAQFREGLAIADSLELLAGHRRSLDFLAEHSVHTQPMSAEEFARCDEFAVRVVRFLIEAEPLDYGKIRREKLYARKPRLGALREQGGILPRLKRVQSWQKDAEADLL